MYYSFIFSFYYGLRIDRLSQSFPIDRRIANLVLQLDE